MSTPAILARDSFIERTARERAFALLDPGARELAGPFDGLESPWLLPQGIVPEADDGVIVVRGALAGEPVVVIAIEQRFQGGAIGEVSGAKAATALSLAAADNARGIPTAAILLLETGGVRLQEANLGLAAVAEICAALLELREHRPVIGVIAGRLGSFGGMSIAAGLCSALVMTREARLGLNGPEVIESEAGVAEFDAADHADVWAVTGGAQRVRTGLADALVEDDLGQVRAATIEHLRGAGTGTVPPRSLQLGELARRLAAIDPANPPLAADLATVWSTAPSVAVAPARDGCRADRATPRTDGSAAGSGRGRRWLHALATSSAPGPIPSLLTGSAWFGDEQALLLAVVPDPQNPFPRAARGEVGVREALALAQAVTAVIDVDNQAGRGANARRPIVAIVDVPSQAYGRLEELLGIHWALAAAVDAYARARRAGHPVIALVVGGALSGGFLTHGLQANQILALNDPGVEIHAMHKPAAARITLRTVAELEALAEQIPPLSYDIRDWAQLGFCDALLDVASAAAPTAADLELVGAEITAAIGRARRGPRDLSNRLDSPSAQHNRQASRRVRELLGTQWDSPADASA